MPDQNTTAAANPAPGEGQARLSRDQRRALDAYKAVAEVQKKDKKDQEEYEIAVHALGADILRSGLAAAMAGLERREAKGLLLLSHLAKAKIPGLGNDAEPKDIPAKIRDLPLDDYILATRETLQVVLWLKRAVQAKDGQAPAQGNSQGDPTDA